MKNPPKDITISQLVGPHKLTGAYFDANKSNDTVLRFTLDKINYEAVCDPDDGYRSYLGSLVKYAPIAPANIFKAVKVIASESGQDSILTIANAKTGEPILIIGTDNSDDCYPNFVGEFLPENL